MLPVKKTFRTFCTQWCHGSDLLRGISEAPENMRAKNATSKASTVYFSFPKIQLNSKSALLFHIKCKYSKIVYLLNMTTWHNSIFDRKIINIYLSTMSCLPCHKLKKIWALLVSFQYFQENLKHSGYRTVLVVSQ